MADPYQSLFLVQDAAGNNHITTPLAGNPHSVALFQQLSPSKLTTNDLPVH
ncbi:hypothetical protein D3C85_778420 [compost metagenome]